MTETIGKVYLVGAGPGDPGLITVRGRECLERADVVVHDKLVNTTLLDYAKNAENIFVGKSTDRHTLLQEEINALLIDHAHCELKAAQSALSIVSRHSWDHPELAEPLLELAREETEDEPANQDQNRYYLPCPHRPYTSRPGYIPRSPNSSAILRS